MRPQTPCPHCRAPLSALARRAGTAHCGAPRCRRAADTARRQAAARALLASLPPRPAPLVVWLQQHRSSLTPLTATDVAAHRAHLDQVLTERRVIDPATLSAATAGGGHARAAQLCAWCGGRCCVHGAASHAFIDLPLMQRWQQANPGQSEADAAQAYLCRLPAQHVEHSCLYHTAQGCALPREMRADICNGYACAALQQLEQEAVTARPPPVLVLDLGEHATVSRAALLSDSGTRTLQPAGADETPRP